ncbi:helix-turn-helix domain-containing protein [Mucilaginibacter lappiensis]|uniref:AraC-like DNA-binding protein/mannose-6-phosphate isomerase-like protein (Cupin superfamily) n=1 Tax=Mucilaginibacter lappiensis TaxID=354630 RepID=A0A841JPD7_9SPHI|nr:helix-turn-helix domain-containing protein [Mucilaginibacter lappiensis]MBB6130618.1 AraC-like DNA-binding protein/mannose-6-phosphate isomerase-like protein (cupin superfamily) [Mucilaginibacter lappiensis]
MPKKRTSIPVNTMADSFGTDIAIGKASVGDIPAFGKAMQSHRDDYHIFFLQEKGTTTGEIDFQKFKIENSSVVYVHPNQVHRLIAFENVTLSFWAISNEDLNPEYLKLLEEITPAKPLSLEKETFSVISEAVSLCIKLSERNHEKLYHSLLKDSCNTLVALVASQYLAQAKSGETLSRFDVMTKAFKAILERNFVTAKKPAEYAQALHISSSYLNECVKNTTGYPVSHHIQQRIILEAKRLLFYSDKSVKEIASELGYDDYPYFSRLFTKVTAMTPLNFRNKNLN